jgi:cullin-associated NEDD8-dissociated protein 1
MHTLLDTCLKEIEIHEYLRRVLGGLGDEEEVKKLCYLMLVKLSQIAPTAVTQRTSPLPSSCHDIDGFWEQVSMIR